mgnify:CR=1 FL=1
MEEIPFGAPAIPADFWHVENLQMLLDFIFVAGMTLTGLMVFFILKTRKAFSARLPALFFASGFFFALYYYAFIHRSGTLAGIAILFGNGMGFLLGPTLYFFVKSLSRKKRQVGRAYLKQLIPFFMYWAFVSIPLALSLLIRGWFTNYSQFLADNADYTNLLENGFFLTYIYFARKETEETKEKIKKGFSNLDNKDLSWCKTLITGIGIIVLADSVLSIYELVYPPLEIIWNPGIIIAIMLIAFFAVLGYKGTMQGKILLPDFLLQLDNDGNRPDSDSLFSKIEAEGLKQKLLEIMEIEKPHLNEGLTLGELAKRISLTEKRLSDLLNRHLDTTFYDFVNDYRLETFKEKLTDPSFSNFTLLALAFESGFKSKTSFNRVFKQKTGMSPSEYRKKAILQERVSV